MASLMPTGKQQYFNPTSGRPLSGGLLYTYAAGTSTPKPTYQDAAGTIPNTNPITLDSTGSALVYWDGSYKVVLKDSSENTIYTVDNYNELSGLLSGPTGTSLVKGTWFGGVVKTVSSLAMAVGASLIGWANAGTAVSVEQGLNILYEGSAHVSNPRFAGGAKGDGGTDDTAAIQAAINNGGNVHFTAGATYKITSPLTLDISLGSMLGCGSVIDASASATGALQVFSSATYGSQRLDRNWTHWIEGIAFEGNYLAAQDLVTIGHADYLNNSEITFRNCGFRRGGKLVKFIDNAWRVNFDHCGFETPVSYYLHFDSRANAGELMRFSHCWFVDGTNAYIYLHEGQWVFDTCSFPGGGIGGIQCVGAPHVVIRNCNLEAQAASATQYMVEGYGSSFILIDGCVISTNGGQAKQALLSANDACGLRIVNCTLPLYGTDLRSETNSGIRQLVAGNSQYVSAENNYIKGTGANDRTQWAVLGKQFNKLRNGDAELGNTNGWTVTTYGAGAPSLTPFTAVAAGQKNGSYCFKVDCTVSSQVMASQLISGASAYVGRAVVYGMWAKAVGGVGNVDFPTVQFLDVAGAVISSAAIATSAADAAWTWIGGYSVVPVGTDRMQFLVGGQEQAAGAHQVYYDDIVLNII
jgi:hypothetical protein